MNEMEKIKLQNELNVQARAISVLAFILMSLRYPAMD